MLNNYDRNMKIMRRVEAGEWPHDIAKEYGLKTSSIYNIIRRIKTKTHKYDYFSNWKPKLDPLTVYNIRMEYAYSNGEATYAGIARKYGITRYRAHRIICGLGYLDEPGPITKPDYMREEMIRCLDH